MKDIKELVQKHREIISYIFWGVMTTIVSWVTYSLFVTIVKSIFISNILSWVCAILFAFITNKLWVFQSKKWTISVIIPELWKFVAVRFATGVFEIVAVPLLVYIGLNQSIVGIEGMVAKIVVSIVIIIFNYVLSKLFVFKRQ